MKETEQTDQQKIRQLHEVNSEIYAIIDTLNGIGVDSTNTSLAFQYLRNATNEIQKAIGTLIDSITKTEKPNQNEPK